MSKTKNILIITDTYVGRPGGSERHLHNFLTEISDDFNVDVIQMIPAGNPMLADGSLAERPNVILHSRPLTNVRTLRMFLLIFELWRLIRRKNIKLVVSYHEKSDIVSYILKLLPGLKFITVSSKRDMGFKLKGNLKYLMHVITPRLKNITAPSQSIADLMVNEYSINKNDAYVIPNGVDLTTYRQTSEELKIDFEIG